MDKHTLYQISSLFEDIEYVVKDMKICNAKNLDDWLEYLRWLKLCIKDFDIHIVGLKHIAIKLENKNEATT